MDPVQRVNLHVTYIDQEGPFLKIWGQTDRNNALYVEQYLNQISPQLNLGVGKITPDTIAPGTVICVKYKDDKYYRAIVIENAFVRENSLEVKFIDYGNRGIISRDSVRSLQNFPHSIDNVPPLAVGFIFAEAHCVGGGEWNETIFQTIAKDLLYRDVICSLLIQATNYYLVRISVEGTDLCSILLRRNLMQPITLSAQQAVLLSMAMQKPTQTQNQSIPGAVTPQINTYKVCNLEPGCQYPVYVSYVNDGPCHFSVQLKQTEDALVRLMTEINSINLKLLEDIPMPGTICLARCIEDENICRAVVTNVIDTQFKVFYVDFGNYEVLTLDSLYQIPFKYVLPKVMANRFSLDGVDKSTLTIDMQIAFKKFVDNRLLHMKVLPSPTRTALPKCELWDPETKTSALDVVIRSAKHSYPEPIILTRGFSQPVKISYVYSCNRFYVQLVNKESELASLMAELQDVCQLTEPLDAQSIKISLPCCALYGADQSWYRSQIVDISSSESITVRYIDYGNEESVRIDQLKGISGELLTVLRPQAIECCLNGYQNMEADQERDALLEELILENVFTMKVVDTFNKKTLVDLYDESNYNVASLLLDKLAAAKSQVSPVLVVQAGNKIEHRKSSTFNKGGDRNREQKPWDKNDRNERNEKPWRQDNRENRNFDKNSNDDEDNTWRKQNKGFNANERINKIRKSPNDNNGDWNDNRSQKNWSNNAKSQPQDNTWNEDSNAAADNNDWNNAKNNSNEYRSPKRSDFRNNREGNPGDRPGRGDGGRFGGKSREGAFKKRDIKKDGSEMSSSGSEKSFHKGPRSSSRLDKSSYDNKPRYNRDNNRNNNGGGDSWAANTTADSWNVSSVASSTIDAAPATAVYVNYDVIGKEENIVISWFHNPGLFYVQQINYQSTFKTLMDEICDFYKDKKPERCVVGAPVIALFEEDNVLYRAKIVETLGVKYKVYYVDFGNISIVSKVYPIEKKFMDLPAQAIPCGLEGIAPVGEKWVEADKYDAYFNKENFVCRFVNKDEEKTYVHILHNSESIIEQLIKDGLAVSTTATPEIEIPILLGQQFHAVVKSVNNLSDIILALECGLAVNCTMHNLDSATETYEDVLKSLLEQNVIVYVDNVLNDYRLEITLYDTFGNKHVVLNPDEGAYDTVDLPCPSLVLRSNVSGYVSYADDTFVYLQPNDYCDVITTLLNEMFEEYDGKIHDSTIVPEEGMVYAVHSDDSNWYRGKVIAFDDEKATVNYIDYGNSENLSFAALRLLNTKFFNIPVLCLQITVPSDAKSFLDKEVAANIYYGESGWEGSVQLIGSEEAATTELIDSQPFESTDTGYVESGGEKLDDCVEEASKQPPCIVGNQVYISHIDSPNDFYLQFFDALAQIDALQAELQELIPDMEILENPVPGILCAAPYSADQQWYRAEVLDADEDITTVRFVDFGNTDVIDNTTTKVKTLPTKLLSLAIYATRCSLKIEPVEKEWSSTALIVFEKLTAIDNLTAEFLEQDEKVTYVELFSDGVNIKDGLIQEKLAKPIVKANDCKQTGFVSHLNSPSEFWIQLESCVGELEWIAEQLSNAESFPELDDFTPGTLCAALFPDDQMWYRARILSNTVAGIELLFIDYGNSCTSSSLRQLPEDLVMTAPLALKCSLQRSEKIPVWTPEAAVKFAEISADGQTVFTVKKISAGETSLVQLFLNDIDVSTMLLPDTETGCVKIQENFEKLTVVKEDGEIVENVALEPLDGQELANEAKENFDRLNDQGTTRFQIEFVNSNTIRLYLDGRDIRPLLAPLTAINVVQTQNEDTEIDIQNNILIENRECENTIDICKGILEEIVNEKFEYLPETDTTEKSQEIDETSTENFQIMKETFSENLVPKVNEESKEVNETTEKSKIIEETLDQGTLNQYHQNINETTSENSYIITDASNETIIPKLDEKFEETLTEESQEMEDRSIENIQKVDKTPIEDTQTIQETFSEDIEWKLNEKRVETEKLKEIDEIFDQDTANENIQYNYQSFEDSQIIIKTFDENIESNLDEKFEVTTNEDTDIKGRLEENSTTNFEQTNETSNENSQIIEETFSKDIESKLDENFEDTLAEKSFKIQDTPAEKFENMNKMSQTNVENVGKNVEPNLGEKFEKASTENSRVTLNEIINIKEKFEGTSSEKLFVEFLDDGKKEKPIENPETSMENTEIIEDIREVNEEILDIDVSKSDIDEILAINEGTSTSFDISNEENPEDKSLITEEIVLEESKCTNENLDNANTHTESLIKNLKVISTKPTKSSAKTKKSDAPKKVTITKTIRSPIVSSRKATSIKTSITTKAPVKSVSTAKKVTKTSPKDLVTKTGVKTTTKSETALEK